MSKSRKPVSGNHLAQNSVTVSRVSSGPPEQNAKSIRLTVKMPSSKLREVTSGTDSLRPHNIFTEPVIITGPRNSRSKRKIVEVDTDEDDDDEVEESPEVEDVQSADDEDEEDEEEEGEEEGVEEEEEEDEDADADGEPDVDADGDIVINQAVSLPAVTVTPAAAARVRNIDAKTTSTGDDEDDEDDEDEEELSELESDAEGEEEETADVEDAEGEEVEEEVEEEVGAEAGAEDDELSESESGTPVVASRASTPDVSRLTKRQRGRLALGGDFLQLPMEPQVKKHLTAEEHAMRRAEMARRRKNLSEKRNEEEKMDTINKLLKKQAPKRRGKISAAETAGDATPGIQEAEEPEKPDPIMIRYISNRDGCRLGVPQEWIDNPAGGILGMVNGRNGGSMKLVEEI